MELSFSMLSFVLRNPATQNASPFAPSTLNPFLTVMLTSSAIVRHLHHVNGTDLNRQIWGRRMTRIRFQVASVVSNINSGFV